MQRSAASEYELPSGQDGGRSNRSRPGLKMYPAWARDAAERTHSPRSASKFPTWQEGSARQLPDPGSMAVPSGQDETFAVSQTSRNRLRIPPPGQAASLVQAENAALYSKPAGHRSLPILNMQRSRPPSSMPSPQSGFLTQESPVGSKEKPSPVQLFVTGASHR